MTTYCDKSQRQSPTVPPPEKSLERHHFHSAWNSIPMTKCRLPVARRSSAGGVWDSGTGLCQSQKRSAEPCRSPGRQSRIRSCEPCTRHHSKRNLDNRIGLPGEQSGDCGSVWHSAPACPISRSVETKCGLRAGRVACRRRPVRNCLINRRSAPQFSGCKSATNCSQSGSRIV